nr:uncharacterized protein LOC127484199 [Oryctolagus cuniculus]
MAHRAKATTRVPAAPLARAPSRTPSPAGRRALALLSLGALRGCLPEPAGSSPAGPGVTQRPWRRPGRVQDAVSRPAAWGPALNASEQPENVEQTPPNAGAARGCPSSGASGSCRELGFAAPGADWGTWAHLQNNWANLAKHLLCAGRCARGWRDKGEKVMLSAFVELSAMAWESSRWLKSLGPCTTWKTQKKLLAPGFGSVQLQPLRPSGG